MKKRRWFWLLAATAVLGVGLWLWLDGFTRWFETHPGAFDASAASTDLPRDLKLLWETKRLGGTPDPSHGSSPRASTDRAINAASRVFNTVQLVGKTRAEVNALLGDPKTASDSIYNFPFWDAPKGSLVYRFDSGAYGWQFNVLYGDDDKVSDVERHWIH